MSGAIIKPWNLHLKILKRSLKRHRKCSRFIHSRTSAPQHNRKSIAAAEIFIRNRALARKIRSISLSRLLKREICFSEIKAGSSIQIPRDRSWYSSFNLNQFLARLNSICIIDHETLTNFKRSFDAHFGVQWLSLSSYLITQILSQSRFLHSKNASEEWS